MCAMPRAPPPESASPMRGAAAGAGAAVVASAASPGRTAARPKQQDRRRQPSARFAVGSRHWFSHSNSASVACVSSLSGSAKSTTTLKWLRSRINIGPLAPAGRFAGHASHRICVWRTNSEVSSAPAASTSGARERGARCDGREARRLALVQLEVGVERVVHHGREIVHAGQRHATHERFARESLRRPVRREQHRGEMSARRMSADDDAVRIRAVRGAFACEPRDRAPRLVDDRRDRHVGAKVVIGDGDGVSARHERRRHEGKIALVERPPIAAVPGTRTSPSRDAAAGRGPAFPSRRGRSASRASARAPRGPWPTPRGNARASADDREPPRDCCSRARRIPACSRSSTGLRVRRWRRRAYRGRRCPRRAGRPRRRRPRPRASP